MSVNEVPGDNEIIARLDRLPVWPYHKGLLVIIGLGFFFSFFDITAVGIALPVFSKQFGVSATAAAWTITSSLIGYVIGSFLDSRLSDLLGRKLALVISVLFFSVGSILSATSHSLNELIVWRFVIGMGIGAEIACVVTYIGELAPAHLRGKVSAICVAWAMAGFAVVPFVGWYLVPHFSWGWRLMFLIGGLSAIITLVMRLYMPESIRWLLARQQAHKAHEILLTLEGNIKRSHREHALPAFCLKQSEATAKLPSKGVYRYVLLFAAIWMCYYIGNYAWLTLNTKLFTLIGFDLSKSLLLVSLTSLGFVVGAVLAIVISDRFERKWVCVAVNIVWAMVLLAIAWLTSFWVILGLGFVAAVCIGFTIPVMYTFTAEHFPTRIRATCLSVTDGLGHVGGAFCGQFTFAFFYAFKPAALGFSAAFTALSATAVFAALLLLLAERKSKQVLHQ